MKHLRPVALGIALGLLINNILGTTLLAQGKITATGGWNLCVDVVASSMVSAQQLQLNIAIDGGTSNPVVGLTWTGSASPFTAQIPLSQLPLTARNIGQHTAIVTASSGPITLADGSILTPTSGSLTVPYEIVNTSAPTPSNPRWIKILGTLIAGLKKLFPWM